MSAALDELEILSRDTAFARLWSIASAVVESLQDEGIEAAASVKTLLGALDKQIRELGEHGAVLLADDPPPELVTALLALVARSRSAGRRVLAVGSFLGGGAPAGRPERSPPPEFSPTVQADPSSATCPTVQADANLDSPQANGPVAEMRAASARFERFWEFSADLHRNHWRWEQHLETVTAALEHSRKIAEQAGGQLAAWHGGADQRSLPFATQPGDLAAHALAGDALTRFLEDALGEISQTHRRLARLGDEAHALLAEHAATGIGLARWAEEFDRTGSQRFIEALLMHAAGEVFAVPMNSIAEIVHVCGHESARPPAQGTQAYERGDQSYPLASLEELLGCSANQAPAERPPARPLLLLSASVGRLALRVHQLIGRRRVNVEPVGAPLDRLWWLAGGVVMGDGRVAFLLDVEALLTRSR
jgi:hypothetical protein